MKDVQGYPRAAKILEKNLTPRARQLDLLERYVEGTQYEGLPDWFSEKKPLWERAPCIVYPIVKAAIYSNADLLLGAERFPVFEADGLDGEEAESFERAVSRVMKQARLQAASRESFESAQACGSACAVFGIRGGRLFVDTVRARWCTPTVAADGSVISLEIKYPYLTVVEVAGVKQVACKFYRRVIDAQRDVTYKIGDAREDGIEPKWVEDFAVEHRLGYCPVVWYAHMRGCPIYGDFDGTAIHEHLTDEIRALDFTLSQRHRAALYAGDPQWTEVGVKPGYNPTGSGRKAELPASTYGRPGDMPHASYVSEGPTGKARKKSPGTVWQYEGENVQVQLHTLPGDALVALDNHAKDLRQKLAEVLGVVFLDLDSMPNESRLSGRGLEMLKARQLDRIDNYRGDFGDRFLLPALGMLIRIAIDKKLKIEGLDIIQKQIASTPDWSWHLPHINLVWGSYFRASGEEEELIVRGLAEAKTAGFTTDRACVEKLRSRGILNIKDVDAYMTELEEERTKRQAEAAQMVAQNGAAKAPPNTPKDDDKNV